MTNCKNCGAVLRDGAVFCSACGTPISKAVFCSKCGTELNAGDKFCYVCGAPVKNAHAAAAHNAGIVKPASVDKDTYPNVLGFYTNNSRLLSISDRAAVFGDGYTIYRVGRDMNAISLSDSSSFAVQTKSGIRALNWRYTDNILELHEFNDDLKLLSMRDITTVPEEDEAECRFTMSEHYVFTCTWTPAMNDEGDRIAMDMVLTRVNIDTGDTVRIREPLADGMPLNYIDRNIVADGAYLYMNANTGDGEDEFDLWAKVDFEMSSLTVIWKDFSYRKFGKPRFFDFSKGIMWTYPREAEMNNRGLNLLYVDQYLFARKIGFNMPALANYPLWQLNPDEAGYLFYFDGENAYSRTDYYHFKMLDKLGNASHDWNGTLHGRTETAVIWPAADKVFADLLADYHYSIYPLSSYSRPDESVIQKL